MRRVERFEANEDYWDRRWRDAGEDADRFDDLSIYPIRYAEMVVGKPGDRILEIGCGLGRVVKHYHREGRRIEGIERSAVAVDRLREEAPDLDVQVGDVLDLPYEDGAFDVILAFGLFHNIEVGVHQGLAEAARCLRPGGRFCISMRPDNVEMRLNERYWRRRNRAQADNPPRFHKWLVTAEEFNKILAGHGLVTTEVHRARNVSMLYRIPFLRQAAPERTSRSRGYRLNAVGRLLDRGLMRWFPAQSCNVLVFVGHRATEVATSSSG